MPPDGYVRAIRRGVNVLISIAGQSRSGKTFTAMLLATGLARGEPFYFLDTEGKRGLYYADDFQFEHKRLLPPFSPQRYVEALRVPAKRKFPVIVVDSFSHEWEGQGGCLDMAEEDKARGPLGRWIRPKREHGKLVNEILQTEAHIILCMRAKKPTLQKPDPNNPGKTIFEEGDWKETAEKGLIYELTVSLTLEKSNPGAVNRNLPHKIIDQHAMIFPEGQVVGTEAGLQLARWCDGEDIEQPDLKIWTDARNMANSGLSNFRAFWKASTKSERAQMQPIIKELEELAKRADANRAPTLFEDDEDQTS